MTVRTGTGCTVTMGTTDYDVEITAINGVEVDVPVVDTTHLGTTGARSKIFGDLKDWKGFSANFHVDPDKFDTLKTAIGLSQTITITFKTVTGETSGATYAATGGISSHNFDIELEEKIVGNYTVAFLGDVTVADAS